MITFCYALFVVGVMCAVGLGFTELFNYLQGIKPNGWAWAIYYVVLIRLMHSNIAHVWRVEDRKKKRGDKVQ